MTPASPDRYQASFAVDSAIGYMHAARNVLAEGDVTQAIEMAERAQQRLAKALALLRGEKPTP